MEPKGRYEASGACHLLNPVVELEVDDFRTRLGAVLREGMPRGEAKVVEVKVEVLLREVKPPLPE